MSDFNGDDHRFPQLENAASQGNLSEVKTLVENLPSGKSLDESFKSSLQNAIGGGHITVASYLFAHGARFTSEMSHCALAAENPEVIFQLALDYGWDINGQTDLGSPTLTSVIHTQSVSLVKWFLTHGADPNLRGSRAGVPGAHMIEVAAASSSPAVLDVLLNHGSDLEDTDALHAAAGASEAPPGRLEMMAHLLDLGMDMNAIEQRGQPGSRGTGKGTPLHSAVYVDEKEHVAFLLKKGADKEVRNTLGQTAIEFAIAQESPESIVLLKNSNGS